MDVLAIEDLFAPLGPVTVRRMFGGKGIYHQGRIVALEVGDEILLKADEVSAEAFRAAGSRQWVYSQRGRTAAMPYWSIPDQALDDPDEMATWLRLADEASIRAAGKTTKR